MTDVEYQSKPNAGPDPFDGETPYPDTILDPIEAYLNHIKYYLGLGDWRINVSRGKASDSAKAETFIRQNSRQATVAIGNVLVYPEPERRATFIHELLHCAVYPWGKAARNAVEGELGSTGERMFTTMFADLEEDTVDAIAHGLVAIMPPSPTFDEEVKTWEEGQVHKGHEHAGRDHVEDEHLDNGSCDIDGCLCGGFEPEDGSE